MSEEWILFPICCKNPAINKAEGCRGIKNGIAAIKTTMPNFSRIANP